MVAGLSQYRKQIQSVGFLLTRYLTYHLAAFTNCISWAWSAVPNPDSVVTAPSSLLLLSLDSCAVWDLVVEEHLEQNEETRDEDDCPKVLAEENLAAETLFAASPAALFLISGLYIGAAAGSEIFRVTLLLAELAVV